MHKAHAQATDDKALDAPGTVVSLVGVDVLDNRGQGVLALIEVRAPGIPGNVAIHSGKVASVIPACVLALDQGARRITCYTVYIGIRRVFVNETVSVQNRQTREKLAEATHGNHSPFPPLATTNKNQKK
jgi:hypothetical protein